MVRYFSCQVDIGSRRSGCSAGKDSATPSTWTPASSTHSRPRSITNDTRGSRAAFSHVVSPTRVETHSSSSSQTNQRWRRAAHRRDAPCRSGTRSRRGTPGAADRGRRSQDAHQRRQLVERGDRPGSSGAPATRPSPCEPGRRPRRRPCRTPLHRRVRSSRNWNASPSGRPNACNAARCASRRRRRRRRPAGDPPPCTRRPSAWRHPRATAGSSRQARDVEVLTQRHVRPASRGRARALASGARHRTRLANSMRSASTAARSPANTAADEPNGRHRPRVPRSMASAANRSAVEGTPRRSARVVHQIVVDQRHGVQQLEGRRGPHDPVIVGDRRPRDTPSSRRPDVTVCHRPGAAGGLVEHAPSRAVRSSAPAIVPRPGTRAGPVDPRSRSTQCVGDDGGVPRWTCAQYLAPTPPASPTMMAREPLMTRSQKLALATAGTTIVLFSVGGLVRGIGLGARLLHVARVRAGPALPRRARCTP